MENLALEAIKGIRVIKVTKVTKDIKVARPIVGNVKIVWKNFT